MKLSARLTSEKNVVGPAVSIPRSVAVAGLDVNVSPVVPLGAEEAAGASVAVKGEVLPPCAPSRSVELVELDDDVIVTGELPL